MSSAPSPPSPTPSPDPIAALLAAADRAIEFAEAQYGDTRRFTDAKDAATAKAIFMQQQLRRQLVEAGEAVVAHDYGPRAPQADVMRRVSGLWQVCANFFAWGFHNRGRRPPPWPTTDEEAEDPNAIPPWAGDERVVRAEAARTRLYEELRAAREWLEWLRQLRPAEPRQGPAPPQSQARRGPDFRCCHWYGRDYTFTPNQAPAVRVLWEAFENGTPDVGHETLLDAAEAEVKRLVDLFKGSDAWGTMIRSNVSGKGTARLQPPDGKS